MRPRVSPKKERVRGPRNSCPRGSSTAGKAGVGISQEARRHGVVQVVPHSPQNGQGRKSLVQTPELGQAFFLPRPQASHSTSLMSAVHRLCCLPSCLLAGFRYECTLESCVNLSGGLRELLCGAAGSYLDQHRQKARKHTAASVRSGAKLGLSLSSSRASMNVSSTTDRTIINTAFCPSSGKAGPGSFQKKCRTTLTPLDRDGVWGCRGSSSSPIIPSGLSWQPKWVCPAHLKGFPQSNRKD